MMMNLARQEAISRGLPRYVGPPCKRCGETLRHSCDTRCVNCALTYERKRNATSERKAAVKIRNATPAIKIARQIRTKAYRTTPKAKASIMLGSAKARAKKNGIEFNLEPWLIEARVLRGFYEVTGIPFEFGPPPEGCRVHPWSPSIDRIDNSRGYVIDNVQIVCSAFNIAKNDFGHVAIMRLASNLVARFPWEVTP